MKRKLLNNLIEWKNDKNHKPLVLEGARQVGKTWLMKEFGRTQYKKVAYINFDRNEKMCKVFETDLDTNRLITAIELDVEFKITPEDTLIIFDEIQECPRAITSLKYFNEDAPQYDIIAAGSLLGVAHHFGTGFPVGKVEFLRLYPLSFTEFLDAMGKEQFVELIEKQDFEMIKLFNTKFEDLLKQYTYIGGMPEVVQDFVNNKDFKKVRTIQKRILSSYEKDFSKHIPANTVEKVRMLWNSVPTQLAKDNKKFIYNAIKKGARAKEFETALTWLKDAGLIYQVYKITKPGLPIGAYEDLDSFKLFVLDVGLLGALVNLDAKTILDRYEIFQEFKGAMAEQYVLQQFKTIKDLPVYYWTNETSRSEVDFVIQVDSKVVPVEVKAATNLKARSLKIYMEQFKPKLALRTSLADYKKTDNLIDLPLYVIENLNNF
ncbi:ATP-binding protein [bacterium]|nr:ATP-binding protein [bacterium]